MHQEFALLIKGTDMNHLNPNHFQWSAVSSLFHANNRFFVLSWCYVFNLIFFRNKLQSPPATRSRMRSLPKGPALKALEGNFNGFFIGKDKKTYIFFGCFLEKSQNPVRGHKLSCHLRLWPRVQQEIDSIPKNPKKSWNLTMMSASPCSTSSAHISFRS